MTNDRGPDWDDEEEPGDDVLPERNFSIREIRSVVFAQLNERGGPLPQEEGAVPDEAIAEDDGEDEEPTSRFRMGAAVVEAFDALIGRASEARDRQLGSSLFSPMHPAHYEPGDLTILLGPTSGGKTAVMHYLAMALGEHGRRTQLLAPQVPREYTVLRLLTAQSGIRTRFLRHGYMSANDLGRLQEALKVINEMTLRVDAPEVLCYERIADEVGANFEAGEPLEVLLIDGLQVATGPGAAAIETLLVQLKQMAREYDLSVVATVGLPGRYDHDEILPFYSLQPWELGDWEVALAHADAVAVVERSYKDARPTGADPSPPLVVSVNYLKCRHQGAALERFDFDDDSGQMRPL